MVQDRGTVLNRLQYLFCNDSADDCEEDTSIISPVIKEHAEEIAGWICSDYSL